jgi:hypothetical protein
VAGDNRRELTISSKCGLRTSSSPSMIHRSEIGSRPDGSRSERITAKRTASSPSLSAVPRANSFPSRNVGSKGGDSHTAATCIHSDPAVPVHRCRLLAGHQLPRPKPASSSSSSTRSGERFCPAFRPRPTESQPPRGRRSPVRGSPGGHSL